MKNFKEVLGERGLFWLKYFIYLSIILEVVTVFNLLQYIGYSVETSSLFDETLILATISLVPYATLRFKERKRQHI